MGEALYKYTGKGQKKKRIGKTGTIRAYSKEEKKKMLRVKNTKAYKAAKTAAEKAAVMQKAGLVSTKKTKTKSGTKLAAQMGSTSSIGARKRVAMKTGTAQRSYGNINKRAERAKTLKAIRASQRKQQRNMSKTTRKKITARENRRAKAAK